MSYPIFQAAKFKKPNPGAAQRQGAAWGKQQTATEFKFILG
jgi:hypothetical protein